MPSDIPKRKRVAACSQCYQKKQKCNHGYPCSNCIRRRLPELCTYSFTNTAAPQPEDSDLIAESHNGPHPPDPSARSSRLSESRQASSSVPATSELDRKVSYQTSLSSCLGYFEGSKSNLFSLMEKFDLLNNQKLGSDFSAAVPDRMLPEIRACLDYYPKHSVVNCLIQHFFKEVNWIYEMIHPTLFLNRYEQWWRSFPGSNKESLEFGILILRICAYSAQFIPSKTHTTDELLGIPVDIIRTHCNRLATRLYRVCGELEGPQSLSCVHQLFYHACYVKNEGSIRDAWYALGTAVRVFQDLSVGLEEPLTSQTPINDLEKDMRRRAFWNLYIWDRFLSLVLGRSPCIPEDHTYRVDLPKMHVLPKNVNNVNAPDVFIERILQAKLSKFCFATVTQKPANSEIYNPSYVEEVYERLCHEFLAQLPPVLDLNDPDLQWDHQFPMLPRQRQMLRISVFAVLCQLFQPLLHLTLEQSQAMPQYKQDLIWTHRTQLVRAAICLLESVSRLHELMGGHRARFFLLSFFTFEPAMLLAICLISAAPSHKVLIQARAQNKRNSIFRDMAFSTLHGMPRSAVTAAHCRSHIEKAVERLTTLQDANVIAKIGMQKLHEVLARIDTLPSSTEHFSSAADQRAQDEMNSHQASTNSWLGFELVQDVTHNDTMLQTYPALSGMEPPVTSPSKAIPQFRGEEGLQWSMPNGPVNHNPRNSRDSMPLCPSLSSGELGTSPDFSSSGLRSGPSDPGWSQSAPRPTLFEVDLDNVTLEEWPNLFNGD
ncbi:hypothetical protein EV356DRAFT_207909 [Viridothelium virens]|uniref:Zn(2)-C6 fungal-type domain-containing protein n=1 Tax=Viridothelium virens TaxID=1048519 RepID=A0A6A6H6C0_VIRVR|nr:hypothetical protein EV356DRAFT_207909 [Viridothelium virens]